MRLCGDKGVVHPECELKDATLGAYVEIGRGTRIAHSSMADYAYCDRQCDFANATIGKFANIASFVRIGATDHPLDRASLHHFMYRSADYWDDASNDEAWFDQRRVRRTTLGHDTWIGHNAQIKPEVSIGEGAVVASGAIVTKSVDPYVIVGGVPAQPIRRRQPVAIAERLVDLAWWDWNHERLRAALDDFRGLSAEAFLEKYEDT